MVLESSVKVNSEKKLGIVNCAQIALVILSFHEQICKSETSRKAAFNVSNMLQELKSCLVAHTNVTFHEYYSLCVWYN